MHRHVSESVTSMLSEFKRQRLVALRGSTLVIANRSALEAIGHRACKQFQCGF